jgi:hypothetical protein
MAIYSLHVRAVPKGVYRFRSHDAANRHAEDCLVEGMARPAAARQRR